MDTLISMKHLGKTVVNLILLMGIVMSMNITGLINDVLAYACSIALLSTTGGKDNEQNK